MKLAKNKQRNRSKNSVLPVSIAGTEFLLIRNSTNSDTFANLNLHYVRVFKCNTQHASLDSIASNCDSFNFELFRMARKQTISET